ncbi:TRAP transporter small permease [Desertibacillus haloalkaliphilus]|uniref:TRAP transporter small permease n=1 Tax=Desertibacillus haloalkaliphilus TaxID=1328930 RepID=UPI001C26AFF2|nr:TRAP transporter small permease [Desertibacillus haloalkaliphilus]MBU8906258.1 TRAP transporter small permease [Desertibacillus haloalkaliphilus]
MEDDKKKIPIEGYACFLLLLTITLVMGLEVIARYLFNNSFRWAGELARYLFIWFIFLGASYAIVEKTHIKIESLKMMFPKKVRPYLELTGNVIWFLFSLFVAYIGFNYSFSMMSGSGNSSSAMNLPLWIIYIAIPIGYALMAVRLLQQGYKEFKRKNSEHIVEG